MSGCAHSVGAADEEVREDVSVQDVLAYYQAILTFPRSGPSYPSMIDGYLAEQAKMLGMKAEKDEYGNVTMRSPATPGMEGARPIILVAYMGAEITNERSHAFDPYTGGVRLTPSDEIVRAEGTSMGARGALGMATILAVLERSRTHGDIIAYFTAGDGSVKSAVDGDAPDETGQLFPDGAAVIEIGGADTGSINVGAPMAAVLEASSGTGAATAGNGRAYVIAASGFPGGSARTESTKGYLSPVSVIAKILSDAKSAGCVYGLHSFSGGAGACLRPTEAQATVILGDYEVKEFRRVFNAAAKEALDETEGADVRMIETERPAFVTDEDAASKALTYIFGLMNLGATEPDGDFAVVNIGEISLTPDSFVCRVSVVGHDIWSIEQIVNAQSAFERISGIPVVRAGMIPGFGNGVTVDGQSPGDADDVADQLKKAYSDVVGDDVRANVTNTLSPLGQYAASSVWVCGIGVSVNYAGTPNEHFMKDEAAIPANVILRYFDNIRIDPPSVRP
ncbi:MAG: hypothetical protein LBO70_05950 [Clostridiales Family XIII bacterium]|nr:hypothetical protein [Clostridiales Family XIII bacterium]